MFQTKQIIFHSPFADGLPTPVPTKKCIPDWYKKMPNFHDNLVTNLTVKKCMPFLDTLTSGYYILNPVDILFKKNGDEIYWEIPKGIGETHRLLNVGIESHNAKQTSKEMVREDEEPIPFKLLNPWMIKTPKNYSCLITNPFNNTFNSNIRILDGIVDTDTYNRIFINLPFFLKKLKNNEQYILKKDTPVALIFPFLRDNWKLKIDKKEKKQRDNIAYVTKAFSNLLDNYKNKFWNKKKYD